MTEPRKPKWIWLLLPIIGWLYYRKKSRKKPKPKPPVPTPKLDWHFRRGICALGGLAYEVGLGKDMTPMMNLMVANHLNYWRIFLSDPGELRNLVPWLMRDGIYRANEFDPRWDEGVRGWLERCKRRGIIVCASLFDWCQIKYTGRFEGECALWMKRSDSGLARAEDLFKPLYWWITEAFCTHYASLIRGYEDILETEIMNEPPYDKRDCRNWETRVCDYLKSIGIERRVTSSEDRHARHLLDSGRVWAISRHNIKSEGRARDWAKGTNWILSTDGVVPRPDSDTQAKMMRIAWERDSHIELLDPNVKNGGVQNRLLEKIGPVLRDYRREHGL